MENRKVLTKDKLLIAIIMTLLIVAIIGLLSPKFALAAHASSLDEFDTQEEMSFDGISEPLVDIEFEDGTLGWDPIIYAAQQAQHQVAAQAAQGSFQTYAAPSGKYGELRTMHAATKTTNQIIIYIIADRYTDTQQTTFFTAAQNIANHLINSFPISEYIEWVQIYAIGTISPSSSISIIAGGAGTASGDITRANVRPFVQYHFPSVTNPSIANNHSWLVVQNGRSGGYANPDGYTDAGVAVTSTAIGTALHEQGHLWGLWDEYNTSTYYSVYRNGPNTRSNVNLSSPKTGTNAIPSQWGLFIGTTAGTNNRWEGIDNVGLYPMSTAGWGSTIWYRPNSQCTMNVSSGNPYCQVCAEHIFRRFSSGRELYTVSVSGTNTTITGLTATGKSVSNDLAIPVVHSGGIVKTIGNGSSSGFSGSSTTKISVKNGSQVTTIAASAFSGCTQLSQITIPASVTTIGSNAFPDGVHVVLPLGRSEIQSELFKDQTGISQVSIPASVERMEASAFQNATNLKAVNFYKAMCLPSFIHENRQPTQLRKSLDIDLVANKTYTFSCNFENLNNNSSQINRIMLGVQSTIIKTQQISASKGIVSIEFTPTAEQLSQYKTLFLTADFTPPGVSSDFEFKNIQFEMDSSLEIIEEYAFYNCTNLESIIIPSSVTTIKKFAFAYNSSLKSIVIPASVTNIGTYAFANCLNLIDITFAPGSKLTRIMGAAFQNCTSLTSIAIPSGIEHIDASTFAGCASLTSVVLPTGLKCIGNNAFMSCINLSSITIPSSVVEIMGDVFKGCSKLTVYAQVATKPSGWWSAWNSSNRPVIWECTLSGSYVVSFAKSTTNISNPNNYEISAPSRKGYTFIGWSKTQNGMPEYSANNISNAPHYTRIYSIWVNSDTVKLINIHDFNSVELNENEGLQRIGSQIIVFDSSKYTAAIYALPFPYEIQSGAILSKAGQYTLAIALKSNPEVGYVYSFEIIAEPSLQIGSQRFSISGASTIYAYNTANSISISNTAIFTLSISYDGINYFQSSVINSSSQLWVKITSQSDASYVKHLHIIFTSSNFEPLDFEIIFNGELEYGCSTPYDWQYWICLTYTLHFDDDLYYGYYSRVDDYDFIECESDHLLNMPGYYNFKFVSKEDESIVYYYDFTIYGFWLI